MEKVKNKTKIPKIIITFLLAIIAIIAFQKNSQALNIWGYGNGGVQTTCQGYVQAGDVCVMGLAGNETFCIYRGAPIACHKLYYPKYYVHIDGNTSQVYYQNGTTYIGSYKSQANLVMAWILNQWDSGSDPDNHNYSLKQQAIWGYIDTWKKANGLEVNTSSGGYSNPDWVAKGTNYANAYVNQQDAKIESKINEDDIQVDCITKDGKDYAKVGPYKVSYTGSISYAKPYDQNGKEFSPLYARYEGTELVASSSAKDIIKSDSQFYLLIPADGNVEWISKFAIGVEAPREQIYADVWVIMRNPTENPNIQATHQNLITTSQGVNHYTTTAEVVFNKPVYLIGDLKIVKVNKDNQEFKLPGVEFKFKNKTANKYIAEKEDGTITYVENEKDAKVYTTDENGEIKLEKIIIGTYYAYEQSNPNYGYEMPQDAFEIKVEIKKDVPDMLCNKQILVKLSGYVWEDGYIIEKKATVRNDLYKDSDIDTDDKLLEGITVRLKNTNGETIKEAVTNSEGAYQFVDVLIADLETYYIEFEYDGLVYTNVVSHIDVDNGSKAAENAGTRKSFNEKFSSVENKSGNIGQTRDQNGNIAIDNLTYKKDEEYKSTLDHNASKYLITANTNETGYSIWNNFKYGMDEVKHINLGVYVREQPDLAVVKDVQNAIVSINGYTHVYNYANRYKNQEDENSEYNQRFNVGVKFANETGTQSYTRAIYKTDVDYQNEAEKSRELNVKVTYHIRAINEATDLMSRVNAITDYYDSNYTVKAVGSGIDEQGNVTGTLKYTEGEYSQDYKKLVVSTDKQIKTGEYTDVYIQFEMNRSTVVNILYNEKEPLKNVAEVSSYSTFDYDGNIYAGIDIDSAPGNVKPEDTSTYEDDTDTAPTFLLEFKDGQREMHGNVFEDLAEAETAGGTNNEYLGNGIFDTDKEKGIQNVTVRLIDQSGAGIETKEVKTDENGNYKFDQYIPSNYKITYTWGNETYDVYNYKGTTQPEDEWNRKVNNPWTWYKENVDQRYTDAIDNWDERTKIDEVSKVMTYKNRTELDKTKQITATSALMQCGVEKTIETTTDDDSFIPYYSVENVDYGIIKRPNQDIDMVKRIGSLKLTLANGQTIIDVTIDEKGNVSGIKEGLQYFKPTASNTNHPNGQAYVQLDSELLHGSILQVGYIFQATNISDLDYATEKYYNFAIKGEDSDKIGLTASGIIDYLDKEWGYDEKLNTQWNEVTLDNLKVAAEKEGLFDTKVYGDGSDIQNKRILYTESLKEERLVPGQSSGTSLTLNVSKTLSSSEEIDLDNETEIIKVENDKLGRPIKSIPGNYIPGASYEATEGDTGIAETTTISTPTGTPIESIILYSAIGVFALVILGFGIVIIKKKVVK